MSTQKAADEMHLDSWVIEALEADDYQRIGPTVYAKGHLKKYASILGIARRRDRSPASAPTCRAAGGRALQRRRVSGCRGARGRRAALAAARGRRGRCACARRRCFLVAPLAPALRGAARRVASSSQTDGRSVAETRPQRADEAPGEGDDSGELPRRGARCRRGDRCGRGTGMPPAAPAAAAERWRRHRGSAASPLPRARRRRAAGAGRARIAPELFGGFLG